VPARPPAKCLGHGVYKSEAELLLRDARLNR